MWLYATTYAADYSGMFLDHDHSHTSLYAVSNETRSQAILLAADANPVFGQSRSQASCEQTSITNFSGKIMMRNWLTVLVGDYQLNEHVFEANSIADHTASHLRN